MTMTNTAKSFGGFLVLLFLATCGLTFAAKADEFGGGGGGGTTYSSANPLPQSSGGSGVPTYDAIYSLLGARHTGCAQTGIMGQTVGSWQYVGWDGTNKAVPAGNGISIAPSTEGTVPGHTYGIGFTTGATSGNTNGTGLLSAWRTFRMAPAFGATVLIPTTVAAQRIWVGITTADLATIAPPTGSAASANLVAAWAYDSAVSANWLMVTGDGANWTGTDSGKAVAIKTIYNLVVDTNTSGQYATPGTTVRFCITVEGTAAQTCVTKSTNVPNADIATQPSAEAQLTTTANVAKDIYLMSACASRW